MLHAPTTRLSIATALALTASATWAAPVPLDVANPINGLTGIFSVTFDNPPGALLACAPGTAYCTWFNGDPSSTRQITSSPNPSTVVNLVPGGIGPTGEPVAPLPAAGSFLDLTLSGGNTLLTLGVSSITFGPVQICISLAVSCANVLAYAGDPGPPKPNAGMVFNPTGPAVGAAPYSFADADSTGNTVAVDANGKAVFQVYDGGNVVVDFSRFSAVTSCVGTQCILITTDLLKLDIIRYVLEIDYDPTFTSFTGRFIGLSQNNSMLFATLNSAGTDQDGDGIADTVDNCPVNANADQANGDGDARGNVCDNCSATANTAAGVVVNSPGLLLAQLDADQDGYGNLCDGDLNNSNLTTAQDNTILRNVLNQAFNASANAAKSDMNGSGLVTAQDNTILRNRLNTAPGPSGQACAGTVPCPPAPMP